MKKRIFLVAMGLALVGSLFGCGKKKDNEDTYAELRKEVVTFVNEDLASISSGRDEAVAIYNNYLNAENQDPQAFLSSLNSDAIPKMQTFVDSLGAIETTSDEVANLKNLYLQGSQKQLDAMNKVASAISEENPDYLTEADTDINDARSFFTQYESQLKLICMDCGITINGSFGDLSTASDAATQNVSGDGSISEVTQ